jgi:hypothetical protein
MARARAICAKRGAILESWCSRLVELRWIGASNLTNYLNERTSAMREATDGEFICVLNGTVYPPPRIRSRAFPTGEI